MAKKEYIDRRSLGIKCADPSAFINPAYAMGWNSAVKLIQNALVEDVAPIVRCKDCIFRYTVDCAMQYECVSWGNDNDYCSWGKRRTNDEN